MLCRTPLDLDDSGERYSGRAFHPNVFAGSVPGDLEFSPGQFHFDGRIESSVASPNGNSGARTGAAGQCFPDAAFEDAQADVPAVDDFHESDVHAIRESWVTLDRRPQPID